MSNRDCFVTPHSRDRFAEHHWRADIRDAIESIEAGEELEPDFAAALLGRALEACRDRYILTEDNRGVWVLAPQKQSVGRWAAVTYLRLGHHAVDILRDKPPSRVAPTLPVCAKCDGRGIIEARGGRAHNIACMRMDPPKVMKAQKAVRDDYLPEWCPRR